MKKTNHLLDRIIVDEGKKRNRWKRDSCMHEIDFAMTMPCAKDMYRCWEKPRPDGTFSETGATIRKFRSAQIKSTTPSQMKDY